MISTSSLQAFSASTTQSVGRANGTDAVRLVRAQPGLDSGTAARQAAPAETNAIPDARPSLPPPRGSLLNLSV